VSRRLAALRIARRTVLRSPGRSLLIASLVGLPVAAATYVDVIVRTFDAPALTAQRTLGAADAAVTITPARNLRGNDPRFLLDQLFEAGQRDPARVDVAALLPPDSRIVPMPRYEPAALRLGPQIVRTRILLGDVREPLDGFLMRLEDGSRAPRAGEVLVTRKLAQRLRILDGGRLRPGAALALLDGPSARVAGLVRDPSCLSCEQVVALPGSAVARAAGTGPQPVQYGFHTESGSTLSYPTYLVDLPPGTDEYALGSDLATHGVGLTTRTALADPGRYPPRDGRPYDDASAAALVALIVALGLVEVVLLAGAAFAVGARRQVRELGLVVAGGGGGARDIRRIVLAQGLVLGALGAALGVAAGAAAAVACRPLWERLGDTEIAGWAFSSREIGAAALVGVLSGLAAAVLPAIGVSRIPTVNALAGRFRPAARAATAVASGRFRAALRARRIETLAGAALLVAGAVCGLLGSHALAGDLDAYRRVLRGAAITNRQVMTPTPNGLIVLGAVVAVVGLVLLTPALIGWIARIGRRLPLSARLAVRDAERNRHRTGPATSAIVVAVTGSVALACLLAGSFSADRHNYLSGLPPRTLRVERADAATSTSALRRAAASAAAALPRARVETVAVPFPHGGTAPTGRIDDDTHALQVVRQDRSCPPRVKDHICSTIAIPPGGRLAIGADDAATRLIAGPGFDAAARRALAAGRVLVFDPTMLDAAGAVHLSVPAESGGEEDTAEGTLGGYLVKSARVYPMLPAALISAPAARAHGWNVSVGSLLVSYGAGASRNAVDTALTAAESAGGAALHDDGPGGPENLALLIVAAVAAAVTLFAVAISVALSAAEGRADLATMAAVGASPSRRRAQMACQALLVGGLGSGLGVLLGTFIGFTARGTTGSSQLVLPWANLAVTALGVPLLAALVAAASTRGRMPMVRRVE
jgi:putative ABC transport system permease protein